MGASKKCRNIKTPHGSFSGRAMKWGSRSKSMDNLAYQSTPPIVPKYVDVKVVEKGNMTSIDLVRRAASADEHSPELGNRRPRSRRNSLPAGMPCICCKNKLLFEVPGVGYLTEIIISFNLIVTLKFFGGWL